MEAMILNGISGSWDRHRQRTSVNAIDDRRSIQTRPEFRPNAAQTTFGTEYLTTHPQGAKDRETRMMRIRMEKLREQRNRTARGYFFARATVPVRDRSARTTAAVTAHAGFRIGVGDYLAAIGLSAGVTVAFYWLIQLMKSISIAIR